METDRTGVSIACELADLGASMLAARLRRDHPDWTDDDIAREVLLWWRDRPGAPYGDAEGVPRPIPPAK